MKHIIFLLTLLSIICTTTVVKSQNQRDDKGNKIGLWEEKTNMGTETGYYIDNQKHGSWALYSHNNRLLKVTSYINGIKQGVEVSIDNRGYLQSDVNYENDKLHGKETTYRYGYIPTSMIDYKYGEIDGEKIVYYEDQQNKIMEHSQYTNGMKNGFSKYYDTKGNLIAEYNYVFNRLEGIQKTYYPDTVLMSEQSYTDNVENGIFKEYYQNGNEKVVGNYNMGNKDGVWTYYDEEGFKNLEGMYQNGVQEGKWRHYDAKDKVIKTDRYKNGVLK